jgi:hypothetical protein
MEKSHNVTLETKLSHRVKMILRLRKKSVELKKYYISLVFSFSLSRYDGLDKQKSLGYVYFCTVMVIELLLFSYNYEVIVQ